MKKMLLATALALVNLLQDVSVGGRLLFKTNRQQ